MATKSVCFSTHKNPLEGTSHIIVGRKIKVALYNGNNDINVEKDNAFHLSFCNY